ncbi:MAG: hypothetical protein ABR543_00415 [Gemmatimonadaceae bacterium]
MAPLSLLFFLSLQIPQAAAPERSVSVGARAYLTPSALGLVVWDSLLGTSVSHPAPPAARTGRIDGSRWWTPFASAALPGAGQALLRQARAVPYLAVEAFAWSQYLSERREGRAKRNDYVELARVVARAFFSETLPPGDFEYYERMEQFVESGVFDLVPGGPLEPELDVSTFNGATWLLARQTFWEDPDMPPPIGSRPYQDALDFYSRRAVQPEFRWSWRNAQLEQDLFRRTIERSNDAFRSSSALLGLILANHALSTVDAFVTLRLRRDLPGDTGYRVEASVPWAPFGRPRSLDR